MLAHELAPGALAPARRWLKAMAAEHLADREVGTAVAQLAQLADDPPVPPALVLPGQLENEVVKLAPGARPLLAGSSPIGSPLTPDELSMPAEQRLGSGQERSPVRPGQDTAECGQHQAIGLPARPADLALEDTELVAQSQDLGSEPGLGAAADDQRLQQETDHDVEDGVQHDRGSIAGPGGGRAGLPARRGTSGCGFRQEDSDPSTHGRRHT